MRAVLLFLALAGSAAAQPNLVLDTGMLASTTSFDLQSFAQNACELQPIDLCVGGPGPRALLRFSVFAVNEGTEDLVLGMPPGNVYPPNHGEFVYSACHNHYHFNTFARYELRQRGTTTVIAPGQKRSFCVEDTRAATSTAPAKYCCRAACGNLQGVQVGWGDLYPSTLACQWIDITGIAPGDYDLCVFLNTAQLIVETNYNDDSGCVPVTISAATAHAPRVKVRAPHRNAKVRVGRALAVKWQRRAPGALLFQDVWFSSDDGVTYEQLTHTAPPETRAAVRVPVTSAMVTDHARVKVYVCTRNPKDDLGAGALQCGEGTSPSFRIVP
jgi:hypothetical protein